MKRLELPVATLRRITVVAITMLLHSCISSVTQQENENPLLRILRASWEAKISEGSSATQQENKDPVISEIYVGWAEIIRENSSVTQQEHKDPLNIGTKGLNALLNNKSLYSQWDAWGKPETLVGTNNNLWAAYLPKANISFVSDKKTKKVIFVTFGRGAVEEVEILNSWMEDLKLLLLACAHTLRCSKGLKELL